MIILQHSILKAYFFNCFRFRSECLTYDSRGWHIFWHPEPLSRHSLQALFAKGGLLPRRSKARLASPKYQAGLTTNYFVSFLLATPSSLYPRPLKGFLSGLGSRTPFKDPQPCFASGTTKDTWKPQGVSMWHARRKGLQYTAKTNWRKPIKQDLRILDVLKRLIFSLHKKIWLHV